MKRQANYFPSLRTFLLACTAGLAVGIVDYLLGVWMAAHGLRADLTLIDDFLLALFTSFLVFVIEFSHQANRERLNEKLRTINLMNHHVRNALQVIIDSAYAHGHLDEVRTSVDRISWALQEVLPGGTEDEAGDPNSMEPLAKSRAKTYRAG